jgi:hypothetical protein
VVVEDLVLHRWRERNRTATNGERFDGCRLRPNTWRVLGLAADAGVSLTEPMTRDRLADAIASVRAKSPRLKATQTDRLLPLVNYLQSRNLLETVVRRERSLTNPGVPDLCLWRSTDSKPVYGVRFVEVKVFNRKTGRREPESPGQREEREFLNAIGLDASTIWMIEV